MTEAQRDAIRKTLQDRVKEAAEQPDKARARLVREGFYTESGDLTVTYGGKRVSSR